MNDPLCEVASHVTIDAAYAEKAVTIALKSKKSIAGAAKPALRQHIYWAYPGLHTGISFQ